MYTGANWHFDGKCVKYIELYFQTPANSMSDHIGEIILAGSFRDHFTFVSNEKSLSHFMLIGLESLNPNGKKKKRYRKGALNTFGTIEWGVKNKIKKLWTFF